MNMLRAHDALAVVHFAPIRRAADEHCGIEDPQPLRYQSNTFAHRWLTDDEDGLAWESLRDELARGWAGFVEALTTDYDGVAAIQAELACGYSGSAQRLASALPALGQAVAVGAGFLVNLRSSLPPLGTFNFTVKPGEVEGRVVLHATFVGHPGVASVEGLMAWFDQARAILESKLAAIIARPRQDTPYPWAQRGAE
jgi:hypothetical protein